VQPDPHLQGNVTQRRHCRLQPGLQLAHDSHDAETGSHRPFRVVLVGVRIPEVDQEPVPHVSRDHPPEVLHDLVGRFLISAQQIAQLFGIEPPGQLGRAHQVTEHDGHLPPLSFAPRRRPRGMVLGPGRSPLDLAQPDEHGVVFVTGDPLDINQLALEIRQKFIVEGELSLQGPIGYPSPLSENGDDLVELVVEAHWPAIAGLSFGYRPDGRVSETDPSVGGRDLAGQGDDDL